MQLNYFLIIQNIQIIKFTRRRQNVEYSNTTPKIYDYKCRIRLFIKDFDIILYGPNGCGKSTLIKKVLEETDIYRTYFTITQFSNFYDILNILRESYNNYVKGLELPGNQQIPEIPEMIKKFSELYTPMEEFESVKFYIVNYT